ncbi:MAG: PGN_0703 family putative restriction endonuclease [Actinomycetota bacterium]
MTFVHEARTTAVKWKEAASLPVGAKASAPYGRRPDRAYPFCLPVEHAYCNLLDEARGALESFRVDGIAWHDGVDGGPSNHLLDSQVQCVNALAPFVRSGSALRALFGSVLDIAEVLPFRADEPVGDLVAFEWIGAVDYLGERSTGKGRRGANTTSADAALRYRTTSGSVEVALVEWKYTERYQGHELSGGEESMRVRHERYRAFYVDPAGPVRDSVLPYEDLFVEPFYQLFRLTVLADQMERAHEQGAERVRLLYVAPGRNADLWTSLNRASHHDLAIQLVDDSDPRPVETIWSAICTRPDRFVYLDSATFVTAGAPTSDEFCSRYGHLAGDEPAHRTRQVVVAPLSVGGEDDWAELSWDGPWGAWLPLAWASVTGRSGACPVPEAPAISTSFDSFIGPLAWWTPLPHLLAYSFGWSDLARGLNAWQQRGRPVDDPRLEVVEAWWDDAALGFAHWLDMRHGDSGAERMLDQLISSLADAGEIEHERLLRALVEGGSDPLHLSVHAPIEPSALGKARVEAIDAPIVLGNQANTSAVAVFDQYEGWYERLTDIGSAPDVGPLAGAVHVDVLCRQVGWLGRYRRSPVTGRWFAGAHGLHLWGQR